MDVFMRWGSHCAFLNNLHDEYFLFPRQSESLPSIASSKGLSLAAVEVSKSETLLPGNFFQLERRVATDTKSLMDNAVALLNDNALYSYIGVYRAYYTEAVHALFRYSQYPQVTFESRSVVLDDRSKYG